MVRVTFSRGNIGPSLKGRVYFYQRGDDMIVASWPSKKPPPPTDWQKQARRLFTEACAAMKNMDWSFINYAREDSKGTPMLPRDALMAALNGIGPVIIFPNGWRMIPMPGTLNMSEALDLISYIDGSILVRWNDYWIGLNPPEEPSVLAYDPATGPFWTAADADEVGHIWYRPISTAATSINFCCQGLRTTAYEDVQITKFSMQHSLSSSLAFNFTVYEISDPHVIQAVVYDQACSPIPGSGSRYTEVELTNPCVLLKGKIYAICVRAPSQSNTFAFPLQNAGTFPVVTDTSPTPEQLRLAKAVPVVGDTFTNVGGATMRTLGWRS